MLRYFIFGVDNQSRSIVGADIDLKMERIGQEESLHWLSKMVSPPLNVDFASFEIEAKRVQVLRVDPAYKYPVRFNGMPYVRIETSVHPLSHHPEKERLIWQAVNRHSFEKTSAESQVDSKYLEERIFIEELAKGIAKGRASGDIIQYLVQEGMILENTQGGFDIMNLLVFLAARDFSNWSGLSRKGIRSIAYDGSAKILYLVYGARGGAMWHLTMLLV